MGGYQYGRGDSAGDDPRSQGQGQAGGGRRGYGGGAPTPPPSRGYGGPAGGDEGSDQAGSGSGGGTRGYGGSAAGSGGGRGAGSGAAGGGGGNAGGGGGGRRGYGGGGAAGGGSGRGRSEAIPGEVVPSGGGYSSYDVPPVRPAPSSYDSPASRTRVQDADPTAAGVPAPRRSRVEERRAARSGGADLSDASQDRSDQYPESALNGRSTRNGAAARARLGARGGNGRPPGGPVKKTGYHRYFDYPRTGKYGWRHWVPSIKQITGCFLGCFFLLLGLVAYEYETVVIPDVHSLAFAQESNFTYDDASTAFAHDGPSGTDRQIVNYSQIPKSIQNAVVAQEDKTFWTNPGVSYTGTLRALLVDAMGGTMQGGSTITQQFVKNAYLTQAQTTSRKIDEIFIALKLAKMYDKQTIMADYLNTSPFGRNSDGIAAGAKAWFNLTMAQMNAEPAPVQDSQAAFLSAMVNSPSIYSAGWDPTKDPATQKNAKSLALGRWKATLLNMESYGLISASDYAQAVAAPPKVVPMSGNTDSTSITDVQMQDASMNWLDSYDAAHKTDQSAPTSSEIESNGGYTVVTTFNQHYMDLAAQAMQSELVSKENNFDQSTLEPGLAAVDPSNGDLVAFYGGLGTAANPNYVNNATTRTVQGGSTFKAFTLATALTNNWAPESQLNGNPWPDPTVNPAETQQDAGDPSHGITNDGSKTKLGWMSLQHATDDSINTAFVRLEMAQPQQYQSVENMADSFGMPTATTGWNSNQSGCDNARFTLGVCPTDPARMASVYSVLADNGVLHSLTMIKEIKRPDGTIWTPQTATTQVVSSNVAATETQLLTGVIHQSDGTAYSSYQASGLSMSNIAGKTGTSTMDITPDTTAAMQQVGYNDHNGSFNTAGIWFDGYSSKIAISVGISRWTTANVPVNGKVEQETVQLPVDDITGNGQNDYGAMYPFGVWSKFMSLMQGTSYGGDGSFTQAQPNPNATTFGPSASASPTATLTSAPPPSHPQPSFTQPTQSEPAQTPTQQVSPSSSCIVQYLCGGNGGNGGSSASSSASASASAGGRNGGLGGGG